MEKKEPKMRMLFGAVALAALLTTTIAKADFSAIAMGIGGVGWAVGYPTMESARDAAVAMCRENGGSCSSSVAEDDDWYYAAGTCDGVPYTGASPAGKKRAKEIVYMKGAADGNYDCDIFKVF